MITTTEGGLATTHIQDLTSLSGS